MKINILKEIINKGKGRESKHLEFKLSTSGLSKDVWETVSAFSNEGGGIILLRYEKIEDRYIPVGIKDPSKVLDDFTSTVSQKFNFCPVVCANIVEDNGKPVIVIEVKEAPQYQKPIYIKDAGPIKGGFKRISAVDIRLTDQDVHRYYLERMGAPDAQPVNETHLDDIEPTTLSAFRNLRRLLNPNASELSFNDKDLLRAYNLLIKNTETLTTAGLLLFGKDSIPEYLNDIKNDAFTLVLNHPMLGASEQVTEQVTNMMDRRAMTLEFCKEPRSLKEIMQFLGLKH